VGKSHLISGLGHALIDAGRRVLFMRCSEVVQRLQTARRDLRLASELAKLDRFDLLVLDDLSYVRRDQAETSVLFELIAERYERKSIDTFLQASAALPFEERTMLVKRSQRAGASTPGLVARGIASLFFQ